jgi:hypothetical protein
LLVVSELASSALFVIDVPGFLDVLGLPTLTPWHEDGSFTPVQILYLHDTGVPVIGSEFCG